MRDSGVGKLNFNPNKWLATIALIIALILLAQASWISVKAKLAQLLIANAWEQTLLTGKHTKPWRWADTWPIATLVTPAGEKLYVLDSMSGQALAFGPGWLSQSAAPGAQGNTIIAAHRDTHFVFLEHVQLGDIILLQNRTGDNYRYRVIRMDVVDSRKQNIQLQQQSAELTLITCYPFHALSANGPLRYVVHTELLADN